MNRRELLLTGAAGFAAAGLPARAGGRQGRKKVLFFSKSSGFEHSVIARKDGGPMFVEPILSALGEKHGIDFTFSKDGGLFNSGEFAKFDALFFYTTGDLTQPGRDGNPPMTPAAKEAFLEAIRRGMGFVGTHSAADTFHTQPDPPDRSNRYRNHGEKADPYVRMLGAEFIKHGKQQKARMRCTDPRFPGMEGAGAGFELLEEWYSLKDFRSDLHVLLVQETAGMEGADYQRPPYPATWARRHGEGRVFYTSMGHREDVWTNPLFQQILAGGLNWALGRAAVRLRPNLTEVTPDYAVLPPMGA